LKVCFEIVYRLTSMLADLAYQPYYLELIDEYFPQKIIRW
jgi:hypothetical protein